jgi:hypothetical protein
MTAELTFRTNGAWGSGKGSNLTATEVDENFWELYQRIVALESNPPDPNSVTNITVTGTTIRIFLTDGTVFGPFQLPTANFVWIGEWSAATAYNAFDVIYVDEVGAFLVLQDHTSAAEFDPAESNTAGDIYHQLFGAVPTGIRTVKDVASETDYTLLAADFDNFIRVVPAGGGTTIHVDDIFSDVQECVFRQSGPDGLAFVASTDNTILPVEDRVLETDFEGAVVYLKRTGVGEYIMWGDLALVDPVPVTFTYISTVTEPDTQTVFGTVTVPNTVTVISTQTVISTVTVPNTETVISTVTVPNTVTVVSTVGGGGDPTEDPTGSGAPLAVVMATRARYVSTDGATLTNRIRSGTTEVDVGDPFDPEATYGMHYAAISDDPDDTSGWSTIIKAKQAEMGYDLQVPTAGGDVRVTQFYAGVIINLDG